MEEHCEEFDLETLTLMLNSDYNDESNGELNSIKASLCKNSDIDIQPKGGNAGLLKMCSDSQKEDLVKELQVLEERMQMLKEKLKAKEAHLPESSQAEALQSSVGQASKLKSVNVDLFNICDSSKPKNISDGQQIKDRNGSATYTGETDSSEDEDNRNPMSKKYNEYGQFVKQRLSHCPKNESVKETISSWKRKKSLISDKSSALSSKEFKRTVEKKDIFETESFSGIRIINPLVSLVEMQERMTDRKMVPMSSIQRYIKGGDIEGDWVTIGVIVSKDIKKSSKGTDFSIWKLCDLKDCNKLVTVFLFGKTHGQLWKTNVASVIGILNASIMSNREQSQIKSSKNSSKEICLTVDNPQKIMIMGTSKDFGTCKGTRRDGTPCTMLINKAVCEFCHFHIQKEYRKVSSKRMEFQGSFSGEKHNGMRSKILQNVIYGGNMFSVERPEKRKCKTQNAKDQLTLSNLKLHKKAKDMEKAQRDLVTESQMTNKTATDCQSPCEQSLEKMLAVPSVGALNLIKHLKTKSETQEVESKPKVMLSSITPSELLKMHSKKLSELNAMAARKNPKLNSPHEIPVSTKSVGALNTIPELGKGCRPGDKLDLNIDFRRTSHQATRLAALKHVSNNGPFEPHDPNAVKPNRTSKEYLDKIRKRLTEANDDSKLVDSNQQPLKKQCIGVDVSSENFQKLLNKKSKYEHLVEEEDLKREEKYFNELEKKEAVETKMASTMECPSKAVSCKQCNYTAFSALDICRKEGHTLKIHNATKRFFRCKNCKTRAVSFTKLPTRPCRNCHEKNYERVPMWTERRGPKLDSEKLSLRGDEVKYLNSSFQGNLDVNTVYD